MNEITAVQMHERSLSPPEIHNLSVQQLRAELARSLTMSAQHLAYLATIWSELELRGEDLSDLRTGLAVYLPQIAAGRLDASAVIRFAGAPTVLRSISTLPLDEQRALAAGKTVEVLTIDAGGKYTTRATPAYALTASQARMVFASEKIRSVTEQIAIFDATRASAARRTRPGPDGKVRYDSKSDLLRIGRSSATVGEIVAALAAAPSPSSITTAAAAIETEADIPVMFKLDSAEHRMLKVRIAESGLTQQEFIRASLIRVALL